MRTFKLILLGLVTFAITALWLTPAAFVAPYIERAAPNVKITNASGTIWNGEATSVQANNFDLGAVDWKLRPLKSLLSLSLVTDLTVEGNELNASGNVAYGLDQSIKLNTVKFDADAGMIKRFQPKSEDNALVAEISSVDSPLSLEGKASINNAWQYQSDIIAKASPGLNPMIMNLLRPVAGNNPGPDGSLRINRKGQIAPLQLY